MTEITTEILDELDAKREAVRLGFTRYKFDTTFVGR